MEKIVAESNLTPSPRLLQMVARTMRHEVGDLLQTVYSIVAILRSRLPAGNEAEQRLLTELHSQAETCKFKLDAIQDLTCPFTLNCAPFNLVDLVASLAARIGPRYPQIKLLIEAPRPVPLVGDSQRLNQVGHLLLVNACQAAQRWVRVHLASTSDGFAEWVLWDDGPGANAEQMTWLTRPFSTTHFAQFGLGVALARRIAELHGGAVAADNPAEGGFRIALRLPAEP